MSPLSLPYEQTYAVLAATLAFHEAVPHGHHHGLCSLSWTFNRTAAVLAARAFPATTRCQVAQAGAGSAGKPHQSPVTFRKGITNGRRGKFVASCSLQ